MDNAGTSTENGGPSLSEELDRLQRLKALQGSNALFAIEATWVRIWLMGMGIFIVLLVNAVMRAEEVTLGGRLLALYMPFFFPVFVLLFAGNPVRMALFTVIGALSVARRPKESFAESIPRKLREGFGDYVGAIVTFLLWGEIITVATIMIPLQYAPWLPWTIIPLIAIWQMGYWKEWHTEKARRLSRALMTGLDWTIIILLLVPFVIQIGNEYFGMSIPVHDYAATAIRKAEEADAKALANNALKCVNDVVAKAERLHGKLTTADKRAMRQCEIDNAPAPIPRASADPTDPSVTVTGSGGTDGYWNRGKRYWDEYIALKDTKPVLFWSTLILGHIILFWLLKKAWEKWKERDETKVVTKTETKKEVKEKKVEKTKSAPSMFLVWIVLILVVIAVWYLFAKAFPDNSRHVIAAGVYPAHFIECQNDGDYVVEVVLPYDRVTKLGDLQGAYDVECGEWNGKRHHVIGRIGLNDTPTPPLIIKLDDDIEWRDVIVRNCWTNTLTDPRFAQKCTTTWEMRHGPKGTAVVYYNEGERLIQLDDENLQPIVQFELKYK